jgi:hypothetical protein
MSHGLFNKKTKFLVRSCRLIDRAQRVTQRQLKRSLADCTWSRGEIASEINRILTDINDYLSLPTVSSADLQTVSLTFMGVAAGPNTWYDECVGIYLWWQL